MPASSLDESELLRDVRSLEKAGQWLKAAEACKRLLALPLEPIFRAEILKESGLCLRRTAYQSSSSADFLRTVKEAQEFYLRASKEVQSIPTKGGQAAHCQAAALICGSLGAEEVVERKRILNEARLIEIQAFQDSMTKKDEALAAESCASLLESIVELVDIETSAETKLSLLQEGVGAWESLFGSKVDVQDSLLARLYAWSSALRYQAALLLPDAGQRKAASEMSLEHGTLSLKHAVASEDDYAIAFSNIRLGWATDEFAGDVDKAELNFRDALTHALSARDHWLRASAYYGLCFGSYWRMSTEEDYEGMKIRSRQCEEYAWKAVEEATPINYSFVVGLVYALGLAENYYNLARLEAEDRERQVAFNKAIEMATKAVKEARRSGSGIALSLSLHSLSKGLYFLAIREEDQSRKKALLGQALQTRKESTEKASETTPFFHWNLGVFHSYLALITAELAEAQTESSLELFEDSARNMEKCIELCRKGSVTPEEQTAPVAWYLSWYGDILTKLYSRTRQSQLIEQARSAFDEAGMIYERTGALGNAAKMKWQTARAFEDSGELSKAADTFEEASKSYELAAGKTPILSQVYLEYSALMKAQSQAQRARLADRGGENDKAAKLFLKASNLLETSTRWQILAPLYRASSTVEVAEASGRREDLETSSEQFRHARSMLLEVEGILQEDLRTSKSEDERTAIGELVEDARLRSKYCLARSEFEEGKSVSRKSAPSKSLEKFERARALFEELATSQVSEEERDQLHVLAMACRAEEKLANGDETSDPNAYAEAAQIFQAIRERSRTKNGRALALGHLSCCRALENGRKYLAGFGPKYFDEAKLYLERAIEAYGEARSRVASSWAEATRLCLDAQAYLDRAETALEVDEKLRFYAFAEKCLRKAAGLYDSVGYRNRRDQVAESLEKVKKRRRFAISLRNLLASPPTSSPVEMSVAASHKIHAGPSPKEFDRASVQGRVILPSEEEVEKSFEVQFDLVNAGNGLALLVKLEKAVPKAWKVVLQTDRYQMVDGSVNLGGKKLDPLSTETVSMRVETHEPGVFEIRPKVVFIDDIGQLRTSDLEAVQVTVFAPLALHFERPNSEKIFTSLLEAFIRDYRDRRIFVDRAGWRTMVEIARTANVPRSALYGSAGSRGRALAEIQRRQLAEMRVFPGERGRGGRIMKVRVRVTNPQVQAHLRNAGVRVSQG